MAPVRLIDQHQLRLGVAPHRGRMDADTRAEAHRGHRRALREQLRVRADADLEVLRPHPLRDEHLLDARRLRRAGLHPAEVRADDRLDLLAGALGQGGIARARSSMTRSSRLATNVTPLALTAWRSAGASSHGLRRIARALDAVGRRVPSSGRARGAALMAARTSAGLAAFRRWLVGRIARGSGRPRRRPRTADDGGPALRRHPRAAHQERVARVARQAVACRQRGCRSSRLSSASRGPTRRATCRPVAPTRRCSGRRPAARRPSCTSSAHG